MIVTVNREARDIPDNTNLAELILTVKPTTPFAVAINLQFVPNARYALTLLNPGDSVEIIRPVTGG
jgi:sulfur carrier protein